MAKGEKRIRPTVSWTLEEDVIEKVEEMASALGLSSSAFANLQLKISMNMLDEETREFIGKGMPER